MGKQNNQNFVNIPFGKLREKLEYLCRLYGIHYVEQEESYTSKASFFDKDEIPIYHADNPQNYTFSGKRVKRGLYQCANGKTLNVDVNGALNILKKSNVVSLRGLYDRGELDTDKNKGCLRNQAEYSTVNSSDWLYEIPNFLNKTVND